MFGGALIKWYAVSHDFDGTIAVPFFGSYHTQVVLPLQDLPFTV